MVLRPIEVVGGNDDELLFFVCQVGEELKHLLGGLEIEKIGGFVEEHDGRVLCPTSRAVADHRRGRAWGEMPDGQCRNDAAHCPQKQLRPFVRERHDDAAHCPQK